MKGMKKMLTVSIKGQITLPKSARDRLRLKPGQQITIEQVTDDQIVLKRVKPIEEFRGALADVYPQDAAASIRELRDRDTRDCV